jgi:hypothetical protein
MCWDPSPIYLSCFSASALIFMFSIISWVNLHSLIGHGTVSEGLGVHLSLHALRSPIFLLDTWINLELLDNNDSYNLMVNTPHQKSTLAIRKAHFCQRKTDSLSLSLSKNSSNSSIQMETIQISFHLNCVKILYTNHFKILIFSV